MQTMGDLLFVLYCVWLQDRDTNDYDKQINQIEIMTSQGGHNVPQQSQPAAKPPKHREVIELRYPSCIKMFL